MKIAIIGRTHYLLNTAKKLLLDGHKITFIYTCKGEDFYQASEKDFRDFAKKSKIPFFCDTKINKKARILSKFKSEVALSMNYKNIIKDSIISTFKYGILNSHPGDLPRYRGNACPNWAILNFEKKVGLTIHSMNEDLDSGPILIKSFKKINLNTYIGDIYDWLDKEIPKLFLESIQKIEANKFYLKKQSGKSLRVYPRIKMDDKIDWNYKTKYILALIRSCSRPFSGAYSYLYNESLSRKFKVRIFRAKIFKPNFQFLAVPGQVCLIVNRNPVIATKNGMLEILECSYKSLLTKSLRNRLIT